jgi:hypothetical protein
MAGLYHLWYAGYPQGSFRFFNDNGEWKQMDKGGHLLTCYHIGRFGIDLVRWTGLKDKTAIWLGGSFGLIFMSTVEVFDGFSSEYGFSWGDELANTLGAASAISQELLWKEQRFTWKVFYTNTGMAKYRPDQLGSTLTERLIKDYNGHTFWLSANISAFLPKESKFPRWIALAGGYGAQGMTGSFSNPTIDSQGNPIPHFNRFRQYYFSIDIDLTRIRTRSKLLKTVFNAVRFIKIPSPTLEFNSTEKGKIRVYGMYPFF